MSSFNIIVDVPQCADCGASMTLQDTRPNEPSNDKDTLQYLCEACPVAPSPLGNNRFMIDRETIQSAADNYFTTFEDGVTVSVPYWIDVDCDTVRVGVGYGPPNEEGIRPGCFGANYNFKKGCFE